MNLRLRFTRALSSLRSSSSNRLSTSLTAGACALLVGGVLAGIHAEARRPSYSHGSRSYSHRSLAPVSAGVSSAAILAPGTLGPDPFGTPLTAGTQSYSLHLHHLHTGEDIDVVYRIGDQYLPGAIDKLNHFLRDHRTEDVSHYDPREFDVLHNVLARLGRPNGVIDIVCGYRTPWSNNFLRTRSANTGVAQHSQHMLAKAIDIRIPGVATNHLRDVAMSLGAGGVGYYPVSQFVHVDVGPVRHWSFGGRGE